MVDVLSELGNRWDIKPFYISFLITPVVSNASELITSIIFAGRKTQVWLLDTLPLVELSKKYDH